jgi:hypothetical protein
MSAREDPLMGGPTAPGSDGSGLWQEMQFTW